MERSSESIPRSGRTGKLAGADTRLALCTAGAFLLLGALWIVTADRALAPLSESVGLLSHLRTLKGWTLGLGMAAFLFASVRLTLRARQGLLADWMESERFQRTLISNLPGAVYSCDNDRDWTMRYLSPVAESLTGYPVSELLGEAGPSWGDLIHPDDRERVWTDVQAAVAAQRPFRIEYRIETASGDIRWVWEQGRAIVDDAGELLSLEGFITDISERRRAREDLRRQVERLRSLRAIDVAIMGSLDLSVTANVVLDQVTTQLGVDAAALLAFDPRVHALEYVAGRGFRTDALKHSKVPLGTGHAGRAAVARETVQVRDLAADPGAFTWSWLLPEERFVAYFAVPLVAKAQLLGVLEIFHRRDLAPEDTWIEFMEALAGQAAIAIDNARLFEDLARTNLEIRVAYEQTIEGWAGALDLRDDTTEGHSRRVTELTLALAERMGVPDEDLVHIRRGALLHDIGKLGVPDRILLKEGTLSEEEREIMKKHPTYAMDLLSSVPFLQPALDIPYAHHERWDGTGYPRGLKGNEIPLAARIFAVADVWDALRSDRPYRPAWSTEAALGHIREGSGTHFDPDVVAAFLRLENGDGVTSRPSAPRARVSRPVRSGPVAPG